MSCVSTLLNLKTVLDLSLKNFLTVWLREQSYPII